MDPTQSGENFSTVSISSRSTEVKAEKQEEKGCYLVRYNLLILGWLASAGAYAVRLNLSIAMVAMVNQTYAGNFMTNVTHDFTSFCPSPYNKSSNTANNLTTGDIKWTPGQQGIVLAAFFVGYFCSQIPGGILTQRFGGKSTVGFGLFFSAVLSLMTPPAAETSFILTVIIRGLMGVGQGSVFPGLLYLVGNWVPLGERSRFSTIVSIGSAGGAIVATYLTAFFSEHQYLGGWQTPFYIFGGAVCVWFVFWMTCMYNFPREHPRIAKQELKFIQESLTSSIVNEKDLKVPWKLILQNLSLWSLCIALFCNGWLYYVVATFMPTYMEVILGLNMDDNGIYSSLPFLAGMVFSILGGIIADFMIKKGVKVNTTRKIMTACGYVPQCFTLMTVAFLGCQSQWVILMFILTYAFGSLADAGTAVSLIDITPKYAGLLYGIANCAGNFSGVLAPLATGYIINEEETLDQWKKVFFLASGVNAFGVSFFLIFAKIEEAPWSAGILKSEARAKLLESTPTNNRHTRTYGTLVS